MKEKLLIILNQKNGVLQRDHLSIYLFILVLEIVFSEIKTNKNVVSLKIFENEMLYTAYADCTSVFLKTKISVIKVLQVFDLFSKFLVQNQTNQIVRLLEQEFYRGLVLHFAAYNLKKDNIEILGINFSFNKKLDQEIKFECYKDKDEGVS